MRAQRVNLPDIVREKLIYLGAEIGDPFLVAVSGGADSTALLMAMHDSLGVSGHLTVAHLDHGVRTRSGEDLKTVVELSRTMGLKVFTGKLDPHEIEVQRRLYGSLEAAMRKLRYRFLHEAAEKSGSKWIVTGHTADDQAETILHDGRADLIDEGQGGAEVGERQLPSQVMSVDHGPVSVELGEQRCHAVGAQGPAGP